VAGETAPLRRAVAAAPERSVLVVTSEWQRELVKLKGQVVNAVRSRMRDLGAVESYYNKITGGTGACENVPTAFVLQNTANLSFLSQTDQLLMEAEILEYDLPAAWTIGRSYRNEPRAGDGRHLAEFALLEFEARDMDLAGLMKFQQELLGMTMEVALGSPIVPADHKERLRRFLKKPAPIITYSEVIKRLNNGGVSINWGDDFSSTIEEMVCLVFDGPVQVTHYPESIKFFNMYRSDRGELEEGLPIEVYNDRRYTVDCVDFLLPWAGETFGASRREESYRTLKTKLRESRMFKQMAMIRAQQTNNGELTPDVEEAAWRPFTPYLELFNPEKNPNRRSVQRSGFGLGMGRLIQFLLGATEVVTF
jgi:asparaginyl-tRNA synthetase